MINNTEISHAGEDQEDGFQLENLVKKLCETQNRIIDNTKKLLADHPQGRTLEKGLFLHVSEEGIVIEDRLEAIGTNELHSSDPDEEPYQDRLIQMLIPDPELKQKFAQPPSFGGDFREKLQMAESPACIEVSGIYSDSATKGMVDRMLKKDPQGRAGVSTTFILNSEGGMKKAVKAPRNWLLLSGDRRPDLGSNPHSGHKSIASPKIEGADLEIIGVTLHSLDQRIASHLPTPTAPQA